VVHDRGQRADIGRASPGGSGFATHNGSELALNIYRAPYDDSPITLYVHGGGWRSGDKTDDASRRLAPLVAYGVTVASVNYALFQTRPFRTSCMISRHRFGGCVEAKSA
jgi:acetyl esterase/lipase